MLARLAQGPPASRPAAAVRKFETLYPARRRRSRGRAGSPMNHAEIQDGLSDYLDGASSAAERASVEAHLLGCAECRGELSLYRRADAALGRPKAPTSFATESFVRAVLRRLEPSP